jgi:membrane-associated protease RseP (regulator of RpoE activity)
MNYKNLENTTETDEILSADERKIRSSISGLKRRNAPKDFDFRLRARIAEAKSSSNIRRPQLMPFLRYVLPLVLVLFVVTVIVFKGVYRSDSQTAAQIDKSSREAEIAEINQPDKTFTPAAETPPQNSEILSAPALNNARQQRAEEVSTRRAAREKNKKLQNSFDADVMTNAAKSIKKPTPTILSKYANERIEGGSRTSASKSSAVFAPPGIDPNPAVKVSPNAQNVKSLSVAEVLSQLGIDAVFTNANWTVKSVRQNSLAERSGVRAGDVVEAVDGEKLTDKPLKNKTVEGKKLTLVRGAQKTEITLND